MNGDKRPLPKELLGNWREYLLVTNLIMRVREQKENLLTSTGDQDKETNSLFLEYKYLHSTEAFPFVIFILKKCNLLANGKIIVWRTSS